MSKKSRAVVIGGSMSGLFAGHMLRQQGWDVEVYERVEGELADRGAGIVAQREIGMAFARLGIDFGDNLGVNTVPRRAFDRDGRLIGATECPQTHTAWERVFRLLRDAFPPAHYHRGQKLVGLEQDAGSVTARFEDGRTETADLLVGADGLRSSVRDIFLPEAQPVYSGYCAWRALVQEAAMQPATHDDIYLCMAFGLPPGEQFLGYPVAGPSDDLRPGRRRYNWVWYRPAEERTRLKDLLTDVYGVTHAGAIPPPLIRPAVIEAMRADARALLAPQFQEVIALAPQPFLQTIYDFITPRMAFGRVAILGDAAFVARPHVAGGVAKAAEDAMALADQLGAGDDVPAALKAYQQARHGVGCRIVERGRALGAYIQPERRTPEERENARRHAGPERVMREIAVLDFLYE
ncbi:MAG: FAD binding domain-containing protein [Variibacter sp.]|nr:FAD binding domain-containing protein [Variibacter sp.]